MRSHCFVAILNKTIGCSFVFFEQNVARTKAKQQQEGGRRKWQGREEIRTKGNIEGEQGGEQKGTKEKLCNDILIT